MNSKPLKRYSDSLVNQIKETRIKEKLSFSELGKRFNIPDTTIGNWNLELVGTSRDYLIGRHRKQCGEIKESEIGIVPKVCSLSSPKAKLLAGLLYGCEGSKYPNNRGVAFSNSNPFLVATFINLLRRSFYLNEEKFSVHLQIHSNHDFDSLKSYWSNLLKLPTEVFIKPTITTPHGGKHREDYKGTCTLKYGDYKVQLKLLGIYECFIGELIKAR